MDRDYSSITYTLTLLMLCSLAWVLLIDSPFGFVHTLSSLFCESRDLKLTYTEWFFLFGPCLLYYLLSACSHLFFLALVSPALQKNWSKNWVAVMSPLMKKLTTNSRKPLPKDLDKGDSQTDIVIFDSKSAINYDPYKDPKILALYFQVLKYSTTNLRPVLNSEDYISLIINKKYYLLISPSRNLKQECYTGWFDEDQYIEVLRRAEVRRGNFYFIGMGYPVLNNFLLMRR